MTVRRIKLLDAKNGVASMTSQPERRPTCVALDIQGNRCRRNDTKQVEYHGQPELYDSDGPLPTWVRVPLCGKHRREPGQ
jgi:hypothetical protein